MDSTVLMTDQVVTDEKTKVDVSSWIEALKNICKHYRLDYSVESLRITVHWSKHNSQQAIFASLAKQVGLSCVHGSVDKKQFSSWRLPVVVQFYDKQVAVVESASSDGRVSVCHSEEAGASASIDIEHLLSNVEQVYLLRPTKAKPDARVDDYVKPYEPHWLRRLVLSDLRPYGHILIASLLANVLALAGILFTRQVYDRVIPAESMPTLYVLFSGVVIALIFEYVLRSARVRITDLIGKRADLRVSDTVFGHAIRVRSEEKPRSTGSFIAQLRELEQVRDLMTSSTMVAIADLPFFFLFCIILWQIAGPLMFIPLAAVALLIIPGIFLQGRLRRLAGEALRESSLRNAMLVEAVQGLDDIKSLQAEQHFQQQWNHYNSVTADVNLKLRSIAGNLGVWSQNVQSAVFSCMVLFGAPLVMQGGLSVGALVAASILASRMMGPMSQISNVMSRWQQAKAAMKSLDQLMKLNTDTVDESQRVHRAVLQGDFEVRQAAFHYPESKVAAVEITDLSIKAGERIAVLGRNGAGKSTLLQALSGALTSKTGEVLLDGVSLQHLDAADFRRDVVMMGQNSRLFYGTIRENLLLGAPNADDDEIFRCLGLTGADGFVRKLSLGLDHIVLEGGRGMSGGQQQALLLSRLLLKNPNVMLLDEPTAAFDEAAEKQLIQNLSKTLGERTLVVATHRMSMLALVDRIIVIEDGKITIDDSKNKVLSFLARRNVQSVRKTAR